MDFSAIFSIIVWSLFFILLFMNWGNIFHGKKEKINSNNKNNEINRETGDATNPTPASEPEPAPKPTPASEPAPTPEPEPAPKPTPASEPAPTPKPAPAPKPTPAPKPAHGKIDRPSVLFFDVETTGLNAKSDRIVQIAWALTDVNGITLEEKSYIIYPSGFTIPMQVARIHGITTEIAQRKGVKISGVLDEFEIAARKSKLVVAHNITFDDAFIKEEFSRAGKFHPLFKLDSCCTMRSATELCKLPHKGKRSGYKWPKLQELHMFLFSAPMKNAHDAMADVDACRRCYYELKKRMIM